MYLVLNVVHKLFVHGIECYMLVAQQLKLAFTQGYLFRPTTPQGTVLDPPFSPSLAEARLCNRWGVTVEKHCMASGRDMQSLWPSLGLNCGRLWIMYDGLVVIQLFITYSWLPRFHRDVRQPSGSKCSFRYC